MNKKNKTLLIALSILLAIIAIVINVIVITKLKKEKIISTTKEKITVKEQIIEEIPIEEEKIELLSIEEIAQEVVSGKWGNGKERKVKLEEAGYNFEEVQNKVDELTPKQENISILQTFQTQINIIPTGEYPYAQQIWNIMKNWGWSAETCAGIIGNMMAEIGGGTLDLSRWNTGGCGYGLIQWTSGRAAALKNLYGSTPNIEQQLQFMRDELLGTNGIKQQINNNSLNIILNVNNDQTPESVAMCFATYYERCGQTYRVKRQKFARIAYEYFMNK